jgi:superfamily I DNA and/or RNA helicase
MSFTLNNHYRSISEQLIYFSSRYFYNDELICISKNGVFKKTIDVYQEEGVYDRENGINEVEAHKVIQSLLQSFEQFRSVIVVTFNIKQAEYIQGLASANAELRQHLEDLSLKVRSLENVQGDEADLVIISATFGKDKNGKFLQNFGPINQEGGKNRINVMVSRAKEKMIVIKSFISSDITNDNNENALIFKNFISYVEQLQSGNNTLRIIGKQDEQVVASNNKNKIIDQIADELKINTE